MSKLYPPSIEGTIPAFACDKNGAVIITVPFIMNRAVGIAEVKGLVLQVKTIQNNVILGLMNIKNDGTSINFNTMEAYFDLTSNAQGLAILNQMQVSSFYKLQLAYVDINEEVGYFSTVGVIKYTTLPDVYIAGLDSAQINPHNSSYVGVYSLYQLTLLPDGSLKNTKDITEKIYSYSFNLYDKSGQLVNQSGELIHNSASDNSYYEFADSYFLHYSLNLNDTYYIQYSITTINGLKVNSPKYKVVDRTTIDPEIKVKPYGTLNRDNGYIYLTFHSDNDADMLEAITGAFLISRTDNKSNYQQWDEIARFSLYGNLPSSWKWKDFTVEQGVTYLYGILQYNSNNLYSNKLLSNYIEVDFEDAFLFDGERLLKIKFNPKVTSFKTDKSENKTDTIGSKYPFITRHGRVDYKEFPISGLISYLSDEENLFMSDKDLGLKNYFSENNPRGITLSQYRELDPLNAPLLDDYIKGAGGDYHSGYLAWERDYLIWKKFRDQIGFEDAYRRFGNDLKTFDSDAHKPRTTNLVGYNIVAERIFKLEVLDWLNNGKPKLFRSPGEGNYIVRLMNISLTPEEKTGRMLHTFSATAYEIAECNYETLGNYQILTLQNPSIYLHRWETIEFAPKIYTPNELEELETNPTEAFTRVTKRYPLWKTVCKNKNLLIHLPAYSLLLTGCIPGDTFIITGVNRSNNSTFTQEITIGATGAYLLNNLNEEIIITNVWFKDDPSNDAFDKVYTILGSLEYEYKGLVLSTFNNILNVDTNDIPMKSFVAMAKDISDKKTTIDIIDTINDLKTNYTRMYYLRFYKRPVIIYNCHDGHNYSKQDIDFSNPYALYGIINIGTYNSSRWFDGNGDEIENITIKLDSNGNPMNLDYSIIINGNTFMLHPEAKDLDLYYSNSYELLNDKNGSKMFLAADEITINQAVDIDSLVIGNGILLECAYQITTRNYEYEDNFVNYEKVAQAKLNYLKYCEYINCLLYGFYTGSSNKNERGIVKYNSELGIKTFNETTEELNQENLLKPRLEGVESETLIYMNLYNRDVLFTNFINITDFLKFFLSEWMSASSLYNEYFDLANIDLVHIEPTLETYREILSTRLKDQSKLLTYRLNKQKQVLYDTFLSVLEALIKEEEQHE